MIQEEYIRNNKTRNLALTVLNNYDRSNNTLDNIIINGSYKLNVLSRKDRAFLNHLVYGIIRWRNKLDWVLKTLSGKSVKIPSTILNIIRIGLFQIFFMDRVPNSASVNTSVQLAKMNKLSKKTSGYINAILRNSIRNPDLINGSNISNRTSLGYLSIIKSFPEWMLLRWLEQFGYDETNSICDILNTIPEIFIRVNDLKISKNKLKIEIAREVKNIEDFSSLPSAFNISGMKKSIGKMKTFTEGMFYVQDAAAQIASHLLSPMPGETVLDACAGLGGKSTHIAQLMNNQGRILAVDNVKLKLKKLGNETHRLGIKIVETKHINLETKIDIQQYPLFDRIMLDAPCSGLGVIRRNPDIKWSSNYKKILNCSKKQLILLKNVSLLVKPKGIIAYVVCSTEPEENEHVINTFLKENNNFILKKRSSSSLKSLNNYRGKDGFFRTFPHIHGIDGFFIALLERQH